MTRTLFCTATVTTNGNNSTIRAVSKAFGVLNESIKLCYFNYSNVFIFTSFVAKNPFEIGFSNKIFLIELIKTIIYIYIYIYKETTK